MAGKRVVALTVALGIGATACSSVVRSSGGQSTEVTTSAAPHRTTTSAASAATSTTIPAAPTTSITSTTTATTTTTSTTSTTTTTVPLDVFDPTCVVRVVPDDSLTAIIDRFDDDSTDMATVMAENGLVDEVLQVDQLLDMCVDNGLDDITGAARTERNAAIVQREVMAQQTKLNELFAGLGIRELLVDGIAGPVTRQRLCAFRLASGLPVSTEDMLAGSPEEQLLMASASLPTPWTSALESPRWILIDRTCQIMFAGEGWATTFVFPTSTGEPGHGTRDQDRSRAFKFNPALGNNGWHNSYTYPAAEDNPLNGNMYKPLYFDRGQAIHGANNVPTSPASKGCARLRVEHMDMLVSWLGLADAGGVVSSRDRINVTVTVIGEFVPRPD